MRPFSATLEGDDFSRKDAIAYATEIHKRRGGWVQVVSSTSGGAVWTKGETAPDVNTCEHGDHPAPAGKRFCSAECLRCESLEGGIRPGKTCAEACLARPLLVAILARGSDAQDLRDAAHEACHALQWNMRGKWSRANIMRANPHKGRRNFSFGLADEITARAVEQLVCARLSAPCPSVESCALTMILEAAQIDRVQLPCDGSMAKAIRHRMDSPEAVALADRVIALADEE